MTYLRLTPSHAAILLGVSLLFAPATTLAAKEKGKGTEFELSKDFRAAARSAQAALDLGDVNGASQQISSLDAAAATPGEKYGAAALRMQLSAKRADLQAQRKAITAMLDSGGAPQAELPYLRYLAGYLSYMLNEWNDAIAQLNYARQLGYQGLQQNLLLADANLRSGKTAEGMALLNEAMTQQRVSGGKVDQAWYDRAAAMSYKLKDWSGLARWYAQKLADHPSPQNWRSAISNYLANPSLTSSMKLDLYRLQSAAGALASERDYHAYAAAAAENGYHGEVKAIVDAGRSAGKLLANDSATASIYKTASARAAKDKAALASRAVKADGAVDAADGYLAIGEYARAADLYRKGLTQAAADAGQINTRLGMALARSGDREGAKKVLSAVSGPWRDIAQFWLIWIGQGGSVPPTAG